MGTTNTTLPTKGLSDHVGEMGSKDELNRGM